MAKLQVFDIERFAVADGPGIRTAVFLKGCPLFCAWCSNPESQSGKPQLLYRAAKCVGCGRCAAGCPNGAATMVDGRPVFDRAICVACGACVRGCPTGALKLAGRSMETADILATVLRDRAYYERSGGGMTLSGGEALAQLDGAIELCELARAAGIHVAVETCADLPPAEFARTLSCVDLFLFDLKHPDPQKLADKTGGHLDRILENLGQVTRRGVPCILRVPVVPGYNDDADTLDGVFDLALRYGVDTVHLLPYHNLGAGKYAELGRAYEYRDIPSLTAADLAPAAARGRKRGLDVAVGG